MIKKIIFALIAFCIVMPVFISADTKKSYNKTDKTRKNSTFVLVHGAYHGGWCWKKLTPYLMKAGHRVYTPTLTGLGERKHLLNENINLDTHIQDIVSMIEFEDLHDIILVGHSYAGFVIAGVAEKIPGRISAVVFLDALIPDNGKAVFDYLSDNTKNIYHESQKNNDDTWKLLFSREVDVSDFGVFNESDSAWITQRITEQPHKTYTQKIRISESTVKLINERGSFILTSERQDFISEYKKAKERRMKVFKISGAGHDSMITQPQKLAEVLLIIAARKKFLRKINPVK